MERIVAWHFTDPGCPWAYSSRPAIARLRWRFGDQLDWRLVLIGLSESAARYEELGYTPGRMASGWRKFEDRFGMPFGRGLKSRMGATSRACRAIIAAREESPELGYAALRAVQLMQFTTTEVLDDDAALRCALEDVERWLEVGGFQPFESYDTALANLDPSLERRPAPERAADAVLAYPIGLTTAEVASIMRGSDLEDADQHAAEGELIAAVTEGELVVTPAGSDALWRPASAVQSEAPDALAAA